MRLKTEQQFNAFFSKKHKFATNPFSHSEKFSNMKAQFLLPFAFALICFSACQKEEANGPVSTVAEITPEVYLTHLQESVLFQFDRQDLTTGDHTGWFVDKNGNLRTYFLPAEKGNFLTQHDECEGFDLSVLTSLSESSGHEVSKEELAGYFKASRKIGNHTLGEKSEDATQNEVLSILAFRAIDNYDESGSSCSYDTPHYAQEEEMTFQITTLKLEGAVTQVNESQHSAELVSWLEALNQLMER